MVDSGLFSYLSATFTLSVCSLLFNSKIPNTNVASSSLELSRVPEARDLGSSRIQGSRGESGRGFGGSAVRDSGAGPRECRVRTAEGMGHQRWGARGPGILECDSGESALEPPSWAGSPELGSRRAVTRRLQSPGGNPGRPRGPGGYAEASCRLAPPGCEGSGTPRPGERPYLVCAAFGCPGRARGALLAQ